MTVSKSNTRFMFSKMLSNRPVLIALIAVAVMLTLMYYNTIQNSPVTKAFLPMPHSAAVSTILGVTVSLGIVSNLFIMKLIMGGGKEAMQAVSRTVLSMVAGACGCISSIASVLLSLGVGAGSGALAFLSSNTLPFLGLAFCMSLVSIKLAANTLANVSGLIKF